MEVDQTVESSSAPESVVESAPESTSTSSAPESTLDTSVNASSDESSDESTEAAPQFTPDFKIKVYDQEKEVDPTLRELMKDEKSAEAIRAVSSKAQAFDIFKERHERVKSENEVLKRDFTTQANYINQATQHLQKKDFDSFFDQIKVAPADVMQWVYRKLQEAEMPPEQRQQIEYQRQIQKQNEMLQNQTQSVQTQYQREVAQFRERELGYVTQRPDIAPIVQSFDQRNGQGAFRKLCIEKGMVHHITTKQDLPAETIVQEVIKLLGNSAQPMQMSGVQTGSFGQPAAPVIAQNQPAQPTLPNVNGRGSSPAKKQVRSIDDLRALSRDSTRS